MAILQHDVDKTQAAEIEDIRGTLDQTTPTSGLDVEEETVLQTIKREPWAVIWCCYAIWIVLVVAFDFAAPSAILGVPEFRKDFGYFYQGGYVLPAKWQSAYSGAPVASYVCVTSA